MSIRVELYRNRIKAEKEIKVEENQMQRNISLEEPRIKSRELIRNESTIKKIDENKACLETKKISKLSIGKN